MENLFWIGFIGALVAGLFAVIQAKKYFPTQKAAKKCVKSRQTSALAQTLT